MKINKRTRNIILYLLLLATIYVSLYFFITKIRDKVSSLEYQVKYMLEEQLNTKVDIGKVTGDLVREIVLHDVTIYHQFQDDKILASAKRVRVHFNLLNSLVKEKITIRNLREVIVEDFDIYIDEDFATSRAIRFLVGIDDGKDDVADNLVVTMTNGRAYSQFLNKELGSFKVYNINAYIKKLHKNLSFEGTGHIIGSQKVFYGTDSRFKIYGTDSLKHANVRGSLDFETLNYLNYSFKGVGVKFHFNSEKMGFDIRPTNYAPFKESLAQKYKKQYKSDNPYYYLLKLHLEYLTDEDEIYINVPVDKKSHAVQAIAHNYLKNSTLAPFLKYLNPNYDWNILGEAFFRFKRGKLTDFSIKADEVNHVLRKNDRLSFLIQHYSSSDSERLRKIRIRDIKYQSFRGGTIKGNVTLNKDISLNKGSLFLDKLIIPSFFPHQPKSLWTLSQQEKKLKINIHEKRKKKSPIEAINLLYHPISSQVEITGDKNNYNISFTGNKLSHYDVDNIYAKLSVNQGFLDAKVWGKDQFDFTLKVGANLYNLSKVKIDFDVNKIKYRFINKWLALNMDLGDIYFKGKIKGELNLDDFKKTILKGRIKAYPISKSGFDLEDNPYILPGYSERKTNNQTKATINITYKKNKLYFKNCLIHDKDIRFDGTLSFLGDTIYPDFTVYYLNFPVYIEGEIKKENERFKTKINIVYDNFKRQWTSLIGYLKINNNSIRFEDTILRHHQKNYYLKGMIGWVKNKILSDISIYREKESVYKGRLIQSPGREEISLKGDLAISHNEKTTLLKPNLMLRASNTSYFMGGSLVIEKNQISPQLSLSWKNKAQEHNYLTLLGLVLTKKGGVDANFSVVYNKRNYNIEATVIKIHKGINLSLKAKGLDNFIGVHGNIISPKKNTIYSRLDFDINDRLIKFEGDFFTKGSNIYSSVKIESDEHQAKIDGYLTMKDRYIFPYFKLEYSSPYTDYKWLPFILEGKIVEYDKYFDFETVINKQLNILGQYKKYSFLSLKIIFDDYKVKLPNGKTLTLFNSHNDEGILVKISSRGIRSNGGLGAKEISFLPNPDFKILTHFSYNVPFDKNFDKKLREIFFHSVVVKKGDEPLLSSRGGLSYHKNIWHLTLSDVKRQTSLDIKYDDKNQFIKSNLRFDRFDLNNLNPLLRGTLTGQLNMKGPVENPDLVSNGLTIKNGRYDNLAFDAKFNLKKDGKGIIIPSGFFTFGDSALQVRNLRYTLPYEVKSTNDFFSSLKPKSKFQIDNLIFFYKRAKFDLKKVKYVVGDQEIPLFSDSTSKSKSAKKSITVEQVIGTKGDLKRKKVSFSPALFITNPNSRFTFVEGNITYKNNFFKIKPFNLVFGTDWRIDFKLKGKSFVLGNRYKGEILVFGGRQGDKGELTILGSHLNANNEQFNDVELILEAKGSKWKLWQNKLKLKGGFELKNELLKYQLKYLGLATFLGSSGKVDFTKETLNIFLKVRNKDLSISKVAPLLFHRARGDLDVNLNLFGKWNDPELKGNINLKDGYIQMAQQGQTFDQINLSIQLKRGKTYSKNERSFNHKFYLFSQYNEGKGLVKGYFNFSKWKISEYDLDIDTPEKMKITLLNNIFEYDGFVKTDLRFWGTDKKKVLSGKIYLSDGQIGYIGKKKIKRVSENFFTTINLDTVEIIVEEDVTANIGKGRLSLGEVLLKKGSFVLLKKKLTDIERDQFEMLGIIESKKGEFDYLGHTFKIVQAKMTLPKGQKAKIELLARTKVRDEDNRLVTIFLKINEDLESLFQTGSKTLSKKEDILLDSLSSSPAKSSQEITLLLGITSGSEERYLNQDPRSGSSAGKATDIAVNLTLVKPIERKLKELFGIDTFNIRQNFLQNTLFRKTSSTSSAGSEVSPLRNTEITIGKYITDDIYFSSGILLLQETNPAKSGQTKKVWKFGLEADLLPILGIESERVKLQFGGEFQHKPDELVPSNRNEGILKFDVNIEF